MDTFDFEWKPEYRGTWKCPSCGNEIWGTLKVGQIDIILELTCHSCHEIDGSYLESITGRIDSLDANNLLSVKLCNLSLVKRKGSTGNGFNTYKYVAEDIFVSSDIETLNLPIQKVRFRSEHLGKWLTKYISCSINELFDDAHGVNLKYERPQSYKCFEDDSICVELCFSFGSKTPNYQGYILQTRQYLDIAFKISDVDFYTARLKAFQLSFLFSLLIQAPIYLGNTLYVTEQETYIHRNGSSNRNVVNRENLYVSNIFSELTPEILISLISNWRICYQKYANSLDVFFEIWKHELLPSEQRFKGYMSVLDGLTCDIPLEHEEELSKKEKTIKLYWPKFKQYLKSSTSISASELHKFDMALNGKKKKQDAPLEERFVELINKMGLVLPSNIDHAFVKKCVRTRHKLTHPESKYKIVFTQSQYPKAIHKLEIILCSYMLRLIGVKDDLIIKTLRLDAHKTITY